jgi:hypothetical protein
MPASLPPARRWVGGAALVFVVMVVLASCGLPTSTTRVVDFVQLDDRRYVRVDGGVVEAPAVATLGPEVAFTARTVGDPEGEPIRSGDAAYLQPGTPLRAVPGFEPWFRLAAVLDDEVALYELVNRAGARNGDDLLDLAPGVTEVVVQRDDGGTLGQTADPVVIDDLVRRLLTAPTATGEISDERPDLVVEFRFGDGLSPVRRAVFAEARSLGDQLRLDDQTLCAIQTIGEQPCTSVPVGDGPDQ